MTSTKTIIVKKIILQSMPTILHAAKGFSDNGEGFGEQVSAFSQKALSFSEIDLRKSV